MSRVAETPDAEKRLAQTIRLLKSMPVQSAASALKIYHSGYIAHNGEFIVTKNVDF